MAAGFNRQFRALPILIAFIFAGSAFGQGAFQNLNFESALIFGGAPREVPVDQGLPHWQAFLNNESSGTVLYDTRPIELWGVCIDDSSGDVSPISGLFSARLLSGTQGGPSPLTSGPAAISQVGTIGSIFHSLLFSASSPGSSLKVSFNGEPLTAIALQNHGTFSTFGADISAFAGQTGELRFTQEYPGGTVLDDIQFSTFNVPEPSPVILGVLGILFMSIRKKRPT